MVEACQQLLRNDALKIVLTELHNSYISELVSSALDAREDREAAYHKIRAGIELQQLVENYGR
jgi:hypothetical protein